MLGSRMRVSAPTGRRPRAATRGEPSNTLLLVVLLLGQLVLLSGSARSADGATMLERWVLKLSSPFVRIGQAIGGGARGGWDGLGRLRTAHERAESLESEVRRLRAELENHAETRAENERLRRLLSVREALAPEAIAARVVTSQIGGATRMLVLDRGAKDGVSAEAPVLAWGGVIGRVESVERRVSKVRLLTDPNSGVAGVVQRSRAQGIVFGAGRNTLTLRFVPRLADVLHGDRVVTSGLDGIFPPGIGIGEVREVQESADGTRTVVLHPAVDYQTLEEVLVLRAVPELAEGAEP